MEASWVVNAETANTTGCDDDQKHPLLSGSGPVTVGLELLRMMAGIRSSKNAG
jgi:hypothetical protein